MAVDAGYNCLIQYLIESGTDVNNADGYPLRKAAGKGIYNPLRAGKPTVSTVRMIVRALFNCRYKFDYHLQM